MRTIYSHVGQDLDSTSSIFTVRKLVKGFSISVNEFVPADFDGKGMRPEDIAVDITVGGKGLKGNPDENGKVHSCFRLLIEKYASKELQETLHPLVQFIDSQDTFGSAYDTLCPGLKENKKTAEIFGLTGINQVFRALQTITAEECKARQGTVFDETIYNKMIPIYEGFFKGGHKAKSLRLPFAMLIDKWMKNHQSPEDKEALSPLLEFSKLHIDVHKHHEPTIKDDVRDIFYETSIVGVYGAIRAVCNEKETEEKMFEIFEGMLRNGISRQKKKLRAKRAKLFANGKVALAEHLGKGVERFLFEDGVKILIYTNDLVTGVLRSYYEEGFRIGHPKLLEIVERYGEAKDWFAKEYKYSNGGDRRPPKYQSKVPPMELVKVAIEILEEFEKR